MKTKILFCLLVALSIFSAVAEPAWWTQQKRDCGLPASLDYNTWVKEGMPCNRGNSGPSPEQQREQAARQQDHQGLSAYNQGDYDTAIADYQKALETLPNDSTIQQHLADAQQAQNDQEKLKSQQAAEKAAHDAEIAHQFQQTKTEALGEIKGIDFDSSDNTAGLKGLSDNSDVSGLKDLNRSGNAVAVNNLGLKGIDSQPVVTDPMVVDARNVPTGLPKDVENSIPHTPAGDRVRKGFEAIQDHDWKVALAWFQDALNHEPGDPGLQRLVDLAQFTLQRESQPSPTSVTTSSAQPINTMADIDKIEDKAMNEDSLRRVDVQPVNTMADIDKMEDKAMNEDLSRAMDDFYKNYVPKHPDLFPEFFPPKPVVNSAPQSDDKPIEITPMFKYPRDWNWKVFFDWQNPQQKPPASIGAVRD